MGYTTSPQKRSDIVMKTTLVALAALMISGAAFADTSDGLSGVSLRLGVAFPLDNTLSGINDSFTNIGLEFQAPSSFARGTDNYLALDYYAKSIGTTGHGTVIPITYNVRFNSRAGMSRQSYAFAGIGMAIVDLLGPVDTVFCIRGGFGMNISDHSFIEAAGTFSAATNSSGSFNTIGLYVGYRF
jgi:hypothetical protein